MCVPAHDGSMHLMLPLEVARDLIGKGWGELHPMAEAGYISANAVMAYAPRNSAEIGIMLVSGMIIGPAFTLFVVPSIYMLIARVHAPVSLAEVSDFPEEVEPAA